MPAMRAGAMSLVVLHFSVCPGGSLVTMVPGVDERETPKG